MRLVHNLTLRTKLMIPLIIISLALGLLGIVSLSSMNAISSKTKMVTDVYLPSIHLLTQADRDLYRALVAERTMIFVEVNSNDFRNLVSEHELSVNQAHDLINKYEAITTDPEDLKLLKKYHQLRTKWQEMTFEVVKHRSEDTRAGYSNAIDLSFGQGNSTFQALRGTLEELIKSSLSKSEQASALTTNTLAGSRTAILTSLILGLAMCLAVIIVTPKMISSPIQKIISRMRDIAEGEGDLTQRLEVNSRDETGQLANAFNNFAQKLQAIMKQITSITAGLRTASENMAKHASEGGTAVTKQHDEIEQIATAINEMTTTIHEVAKNAAMAAESAHTSEKNAAEGQRIISQTVHAIETLSNQVNAASGIVEKLHAESGHIGKVLDVIRSIAEQTNLLALNAAIEAARAGEQGRGFAVVADEVRILASRTHDSTKEIEVIIKQLQNDVSTAVKSMDMSRSMTQDGVQQAANVGSSFQSITNSVTNINSMNTHIASAAEEQSAAAEEINKNVSAISVLTDKTAKIVQQTNFSSQEVAKLAEELQQRVSLFKT